MALWLIRKRWLWLGLSILILFSGYPALKATFKFWGNEQNPTAEHLKVMTYNVHGLAPLEKENHNAFKEKVFKLIESEKPDVLCLQEFYTSLTGKSKNVALLQERLGLRYAYFQSKGKDANYGYGLVILSKYPIKNKGLINFNNTNNGNMSIYADIQVKTRLFRVYNVHLQSIAFEQQDYDFVEHVKEYTINTDIQPSKRILSMLKSAFIKRSEQVEILKAEMAKCQIPYLIAGDFNDTPASYAVRQLTKDLKNAFVEQGSRLGKTYNGKFPNFQIDYIVTTPDCEVLSYKIIEEKLSDHFPVSAAIVLP